MTLLMQELYDYIQVSQMDRYIDGFARDTYDGELQRLYNALSAVLPTSCQELLKDYTRTMQARSLIEKEALFEAAFLTARELP